jgi:hypothetical protein
MQSHWARYLCVLTAGFAENIVRLIYSRYISKTANAATARYAVAQIDQLQNPKATRFIDVARAFNEGWGRDLEAFLEDNFRKDAINSIMSNRHLIAHGKSSSITISSVQQYLTRIVEVARFIETQCGT